MTTYEQVADSIGLDPKTRHRYTEYMKLRWSSTEREKVLTGYALEWAGRFKSGYEYEASDSIGKAVLRLIDEEAQ